MTHNVRLNPDSFYRNGVPLPASFYQGVDTAQSKAIDADTGGTWNPSAPIQIAGAGVMFAGPTTTAGGASITTPPGSGKRVVLAADDFIELSAGHTMGVRTLVTSVLASARIAGPLRWNSAMNAGYQAFQYVAADVRTPGQQAMAVGKRLLVPLRVHHGAQFQSAALSFTVAIARTVLPDNFPKMRIYRVNAAGVIDPLAAPPMAGVALGGWVSFSSPSTPTSYSIQTHTIQYVIRPNEIIDAANYGYMAEIVDESSSSGSAFNTAAPGNLFTTITSAFHRIAQLGFQ